MKDAIALTRMMKLYYHHLHNISSGVAFAGDHEMMAEFYAAMDVAYDSLVERHMGLGGSMGKSDLMSIIEEAHEVLEQIPESDDMEVHFHYAIALESSLRAELEAACEGASKGAENLLAQLSDDSEVRVYKLKQRVK